MRICQRAAAIASSLLLPICIAAYAQDTPIVRVSEGTEREELVVQPGLTLLVQFACSPKVMDSRVDQDGRVTLGHLGELEVAGLSLNELKSLLESHARDSLVQLVLQDENGTWSLAPGASTTCTPTGDFPEPNDPASGKEMSAP
jgi:protein involved in polysaccharide export with SLBB domain